MTGLEDFHLRCGLVTFVRVEKSMIQHKYDLLPYILSITPQYDQHTVQFTDI